MIPMGVKSSFVPEGNKMQLYLPIWHTCLACAYGPQTSMKPSCAHEVTVHLSHSSSLKAKHIFLSPKQL